jgi:hypothetical protein
MTDLPAGCRFRDVPEMGSEEDRSPSFMVAAAPAHREWIASYLPQARELLKSDLANLAVVPMGLAGEIVWKRLPKQLAISVAAIRPEALIFARRSKSAPPACLIDFIESTSADKLVILPPVMTPMDDAELPKLVPSARRLPQPLLNRARAIPANNPDGTALKAGLLLIADDLHGSHEYSQSIEGEGRHRAGDYWHAIMHRREPDYGNSKYWIRRVGSHPLFPELAELATNILKNSSADEAAIWSNKLTRKGWDAFAFVDLCQQCARAEDSSLGLAARRIQWMEMLLLLDHTSRDAMFGHSV